MKRFIRIYGSGSVRHPGSNTNTAVYNVKLVAIEVGYKPTAGETKFKEKNSFLMTL